MSSNSEFFCLKWKNHASNFTKCLIESMVEESFVDVTLACEDGSLKAHKLVLSTCSLYFKELLKSNPCKHPIVIFKDMKMRDLKAIVDFMYKGEVNISRNQLSTLLKTAEILRVKGLTESSESTTRSSGDNLEQQLLENDNHTSNSDADSAPVQSTSVSIPVTNKRKKRKIHKRSHNQEGPIIPHEVDSSSDEIPEEMIEVKPPVDSDDAVSQVSESPQKIEMDDDGICPRVPSPNVVQTRRRAQQSRLGSFNSIQSSSHNQSQSTKLPVSRRYGNDANSEEHEFSWVPDTQHVTDGNEQSDPTIDKMLDVYEGGGQMVSYVDDTSTDVMSVNTGQNSSSRMCACHLCHVTFTAYSSLRRHMQRHFADPETYECDICQNRYTRKDYLKRHRVQKHGIR
ncbi:Protein bric-a-brac 1-like protein [Leptotrombidium deliense]|uniref:Protein bric-a-brac 1-like protein n=1 Tax=Leptotrombidium deliense TaxID=299467 RepID=A0A443SUD0_9ACAR|nr:Protein bric-a-brac 1-like protein [Leptotrombidium deliense]